MSYRGFFRSARLSFVVLAFVGRLPYAIVPLGTLLLVQASTGSYTVAGIAAGAQSLAIAAGGVGVGAVARWIAPRRIGFWAAVVNAAAIGLLLVAGRTGGPATIVVAAVLVGVTQPQVGPLVRVHWSRWFRDAEPCLVRTALSYEGAADEASFVLGPVLVGALLLVPTAAVGIAQGGPLVGAAVLLVAAAAPLARRYTELPVDEELAAQPGQRDGAVHWPSLLTLTAAMVAVGAIFGAIQTGAAAYAGAAGAPQLAGLYFAELGVGSALAGAACAWLPPRFGLAQRRWIFPLVLTGGMGLLLWGTAHHLLPVVIAVAGLTVGPYMVTLYALVEDQTPLPAMATAMAVLCAGGPVGAAAGQLAAGLLVDTHGPSAAFALAPVGAAAGIAASLLNALIRGRVDHTGGTAPPNASATGSVAVEER